MKTSERKSKAEYLASLPKSEREKILNDFSQQELETLYYDWHFWARSSQLPPDHDDWYIWLIIAGRGWGKTRVGAEQVIKWQQEGYKRIALVGQTPAEVRDTMLEGESGILNISPPWNKPYYEPSKRRLTWPNGAIATAYSAENPELLRGPQHEKAWVDELAKFRYIDETWDNLMFGLRLGDNPQVVVTTTPKPIKLLKDVMDQDKVLLTRGSTYENKANLSDIFMDTIIERYTGTRIGRQEIYAEILDDNPEALWNREMIEKNRVFKYPELKRVVVGIDPAGTSKEKSDETGIVTAGLGEDGFIYVLDDSTLKASPDSWGSAAVTAYNKYRADRIIGEQNNGGDMVEHVVRSVDTTVSFKSVHASRGKQTRAEPVAALYEQDKVKHVGQFTELEDQMCEWDPTDQESPDRIDALVWAIWELKIQGTEFVFV